MKRKSYADLEKYLVELNDVNSKLTRLVMRVKDALNISSYNSSDDDIFQALGKIKEKRDSAVDTLDKINGSINENVLNLINENKKLWYLIRVSMKDPSIELDNIKPGESGIDMTGANYKNPFLR